MKLTFTSEGDFSKVREWLSKNIQGAPLDTLKTIAVEGEKALSASTPKQTGETASGWSSEIVTGFKNSEIFWNNTAHPGLTVNVARIIDQGHATGTGGYVPPRPYIKSAMDSVWKNASDRITNEVTR